MIFNNFVRFRQKIGAKNAFALKMIDHLDEQVKQQDSAVSKNFQAS